jgi:hypothetical protein
MEDLRRSYEEEVDMGKSANWKSYGWPVGALLLAAAGVVVLTGCSGFNKQWRASMKQPLPPDDVSGPWQGQWLSAANGHNGKLRCVMTKKSAGEYDAAFHAKYKRILGFGYTVPMKVVRDGQSFRFTGEADLGKLAGGLYTYKGAATTTNFFSTYDSKYDHGTFEMKRPK